MKKIIALILGIITIFPNIVKADEEIVLNYTIGDFNGGVFNNNYNYETFEEWFSDNQEIITNLRNDLLEYYENEGIKENYPYYIIGLSARYDIENEEEIYMTLVPYDTIPEIWYRDEYSGYCYGANINCYWTNESYATLRIETSYKINTTTYINPEKITDGGNIYDPIHGAFENETTYYDHRTFESNFDLKLSNRQDNIVNKITIGNYRGGNNLIINKGEIAPITTTDLLNQNYREVNLNNYDYVILTLKNYNQDKDFNSVLKVKGMIGITPVYNYGQTSKDAVTGVKVQDRCNMEYENYTNYPLYILKQDLQNNVVYIVKSCKENSSFKYDTNIFNIFYVTEQNREDPTVTIGGQTYHTIPFNDLPSTANKNEEENYIPGESGNINDTGGLSGAIKGVQQKMSEIWDVFTYFTGLINQIFSTMPQELRIILISAFTIVITLGLIKIFIN